VVIITYHKNSGLENARRLYDTMKRQYSRRDREHKERNERILEKKEKKGVALFPWT